MIIKACKGYELEKEKPNTSEDYFNRSEVTYVEDGVEKNLHVLYVRYYEENFNQFTPFEQNPVFNQNGNEIFIKDLVALICLLKNPGLRHRKRVYINTVRDFTAYFQEIDTDKVIQLVSEVRLKHSVEIKSPLQFIKQPN
jgi:hypothetical protein